MLFLRPQPSDTILLDFFTGRKPKPNPPAEPEKDMEDAKEKHLSVSCPQDTEDIITCSSFASRSSLDGTRTVFDIKQNVNV